MRYFIGIAVMLSVGLSGCLDGSDVPLVGGSSSDGKSEGQVALQLVWPGSTGGGENAVTAAEGTLPENVVTISIAVTSVTSIVVVAINVQASAGSASIPELPPAADYGIEVWALDSAGTVLFRGVAINVTVQAGRTTTVIIVMEPVTTGRIDVSW